MIGYDFVSYILNLIKTFQNNCLKIFADNIFRYKGLYWKGKITGIKFITDSDMKDQLPIFTPPKERHRAAIICLFTFSTQNLTNDGYLRGWENLQRRVDIRVRIRA